MMTKKRKSLLGISGFAYSALQPWEQRVYRRLCNSIMNCRKIDLFDYPGLNQSDISRILLCIDMDHPEFFWMDGYQSKWAMTKNALNLMQDGGILEETLMAMENGVDYDNDGEVSFFERRLAGGRAALEANPLIAWSIEDSLTLSPFWGARRIDRIQKQFDKYQAGCRALIPEQADDYQILRTVFEYVAGHTSYSFKKMKKSQDVRSVFIERESVCKGYAEALQYLLLGFGIPCFTAQGIAGSDLGIKGAHAWNYVMIDGVWNIVDVTAGDWDLELRPERLPNIPNHVRADFVDHRCMCLDGSSYKPADFIEYPKTGTTSDYFEYEGYILHPEAWRAFVRICCRLHAGLEKYVQVRCVGDYAETEEWMRSAITLVVRICVVVDKQSKVAFTLDSATMEEARSLSRDEINEAGWGNFKLNIHPMSAKRDVCVLTSYD